MKNERGFEKGDKRLVYNRVAVIGAGVGGLATAIRLAASGFEVEVFEKNPRAGGRVDRLRADGFTFDTGPSLLFMTDTYRELFRYAGRRLEDYLTLTPLDGEYRVHFGDGDTLSPRRTLPELIAELERIEPGVTPRFYRFLEKSCYRYRLGRSEFVERDFERARDFFSLRNLKLLSRTGALGGYHRSVSRYFHTEKLRQAFSLQTMYLGLSPFEAPAIYTLLPYTELAEDGLWFPVGGMYSLIEAMVRLAQELGVDFHFDAAVEEILASGGRVRGLRVNGEEVSADTVVANADLPYVYRCLLGKEASADFRLRGRQRLEYTASAFMLYLGVEGNLEHLRHHNFFLSEDFRRNFEQIFIHKTLPKDPSFYVVVPSRTEPSMSPPDHSSVFVLVPVPHLGSKVDWSTEGPDFRRHIHALLRERAGIEGNVRFESTRTPADWQRRYNLEKGAAFGLGHGIGQVGYFRPALASRSVGGLYFVGASTHPGTGVPLVTIGARLTAERVMREMDNA